MNGDRKLRRESQDRWAWLGLLLIGLCLVGASSLPTFADQEATSYSESGKWFVPSPVAGTISEALELAKPGDEIIVDSTYNSRMARAVGTDGLIPAGSPELFPLRIEKPRIKISCQALPRWDGGWDRPRIFAPPDYAALVIAADGVTVEGCEISVGGVGIVTIGVTNARISGNLLSSLREGIRLIETSKSVIQDNLLTGIEGVGIYLESSRENLLQDNRVEKSGAGLFLLGSRDNQVGDDIYRDNSSVGLHLEDSNGNLLDGLTVTGNGGEGMLLVNSNSNRITTSEISDNRGGGIALVGSDKNEIIANLLEGNGTGPILVGAGELILFTTPILSSQTGPMEGEDPYAEARQGEAELQAKVRELDDWIIGLEQDLIGMIRDVQPSPVQTSSRRLEMNLDDALSKAVSINEASIPLAIDPLIEDVEDKARTLRRKELGPRKEEILEELEALLQLLSEVDDQLDQLKLILDDGEREDNIEEFDDVVDWLEEALSASGVNEEHLGEALEGARRKLEAALIQNGRADLEISKMMGYLIEIDEKLPSPPIPDFAVKGTGIIGEIVASSIPDGEITQFEGELVGRLNKSDGILLKAERLGLLPIDIGDIEIERRSLPTPGGNLILSNFGDDDSLFPWKGEHSHLFSGMVKTGCLDRRSQSPRMEGACSFPTEMVLATEVGGENDAEISDDLKGQRLGERGATLSRALVYPNPIRGTSPVLFSVEGQGIAQVLVEIFDLAGSEVCNSGWQVGHTFEWHLQNRWGEVVANGVYLYVVMVHGLNGEVIRSKVGKLAVLR